MCIFLLSHTFKSNYCPILRLGKEHPKGLHQGLSNHITPFLCNANMDAAIIMASPKLSNEPTK